MAENIPVSSTEVKPAASVQRYRRLVTGVDADGRSIFLEDETATDVHVIADLDTFAYTNLWCAPTTPVDNSGPSDDGLGSPGGIAPPERGSIFRMVEFPPDSDWDHQPGMRDRMVHATPSLDYAIVLSGEIWAVLERGERRMGPGDVLIQRGTAHAWSNRSTRPAVVAFVLVGGTAQP
ncbi:cupin domain-containing protein [Arthrobacter sp. P2b]|uniref:cupin domain-containing protein n=1 Tax=Arthrobacter sp. P2b TaxID=1938741 RepID=UPI0009A7BC88|nr:cupin domain-containing protein [Arthrobacter sp. P2b]SLK14680.1 hypothetical protein SAMN06272721_12230 [Arthrobacter sp. P2b]